VIIARVGDNEVVDGNEKPSSSPPRIGVAKGEFEVPESFFEPLADEILSAFEGDDIQ
jgi:hypothetical protein